MKDKKLRQVLTQIGFYALLTICLVLAIVSSKSKKNVSPRNIEPITPEVVTVDDISDMKTIVIEIISAGGAVVVFLIGTAFTVIKFIKNKGEDDHEENKSKIEELEKVIKELADARERRETSDTRTETDDTK